MASERVELGPVGVVGRGGSSVRENHFGVWLDGELCFVNASINTASAFEDGLRLGLDAAGPDIVADTARALDEDQDEPTEEPVDLKPGDLVELSPSEGSLYGYVESAAGEDACWVRVPFGIGDGRYYAPHHRLRFIRHHDQIDDETQEDRQDAHPVTFKVGDRVRDDEGDAGTVVGLDGDLFRVRYDDEGIGDDGLVLYDRGDLDVMKLTLLPPGVPAVAFRIGDRVVDRSDDAGTVVAVHGDKIDVRYDDPRFGDGGRVDGLTLNNLGFRLLPPAARPAVTPHPDRPDTADGEVPDGWREDCMGSLYAPGNAAVTYVPERDWWYAGGVGIGVLDDGPRHFYLRSEAIGRLQELLAEGGAQ